MKTKHFILFFIVIFSFISVASMCEDDPDVDPEADKRENITDQKKWACERYINGDLDATYEVEITKDVNDENKIIVTNFFNNGESANATMTGFNLTLPSQDVGGFTLVGTGTIQDDYQRIDWNYTVNGEDNVEATFTPGTLTKKLEN